MKIHELYEAMDLVRDGRGNVIVWDAQRRLEVLVPEKEAQTLQARHQLVGGALNMPTPSKYPEAPASLHNKNSNSSDDPEPTTAFGHFKQGFKKGFRGTNKFIKDLPYTTAGRVAGKVSSFAQQQNKLK